MDPYSDSLTIALFFAETRTASEVEELAHLADNLGRYGAVKRLSEGVITSYAVSIHNDAEPLLEGLAVTLKRDFVFGHVASPFNDVIFDALKDLVSITGSRFLLRDTCALCGADEPFPEPVTVLGEDGRPLSSAVIYCRRCAQAMAVGMPLNVVRRASLLNAVPTRLGCTVRITEVQWTAIVSKHPVMVGRELDVQRALLLPDEIRRSKRDPSVFLFYRLDRPRRWVCAVIKQTAADDAFVVTAYPTDAIKIGDVVYRVG